MKSEDSKEQTVGARDAGDADISVPDSAPGLPVIRQKTKYTQPARNPVESRVFIEN